MYFIQSVHTRDQHSNTYGFGGHKFNCYVLGQNTYQNLHVAAALSEVRLLSAGPPSAKWPSAGHEPWKSYFATWLKFGISNRLQTPHSLCFDFGDITRFFPRIDRIFSGEALNPFFGAQDEGFSEFRSR